MTEKPEKKKKLLIATDNFLPRWDGITRFLSEIIPRLKKYYDITVLCSDFGRIRIKDVKIVKIPQSKIKFGDISPAKLRPKIVREEIKKSDLVFTQTIGPVGMLSIWYAKIHQKPVASFIHSIEWELFSKAYGGLFKNIIKNGTLLLNYIIYNKSNLLITPSESVSELLTWHDIKTRKRVVHLGVDSDKFSPASKLEARKKIGLEKDVLVIGNHGRLGREKDMITLLRAFLRVKKKIPTAKLLIVGEGVESIKKTLASKEGVILPGVQNDVLPYIRSMDIYVLSSLTETTSLATLEAMSCGIPIISTKVGFIKDYITDCENGMYFEKKDSYGLAKKILFLTGHEELRKKMKINARKSVIEEFNWNKTVEGIVSALNELI